jgi:hypothetical protein
MRKSKILLRLTLGSLFAMTNSSYAGVGDMLDAIQAQKITYRVSVVDSAGNPVPYATLWEVVSYHRNRYDPVALMDRLTSRYAADADNVTTARLHPSLMVYYTDQNGQLELIVEAKAKEDKEAGVLPVAIAALKRGYQPSFVGEESKLNESKAITIRLRPITHFAADPALIELDEIRGKVEASKKTGIQSPQHMQILSDAVVRIRQLADQAEQSGKGDVASTLFHYLAYMPSIEELTDVAGKRIGIKVTNGYDGNNPRRRSDYERSLRLNKSNPQLLYERMMQQHRDAFGPGAKASDAQRKAYLTDMEALHERFGDRLWLADFPMEWRQYAQLGAYENACSHLYRFYQFEPTYSSPSEWAEQANHIAIAARNRGDTYTCKIEELVVPFEPAKSNRER